MSILRDARRTIYTYHFFLQLTGLVLCERFSGIVSLHIYLNYAKTRAAMHFLGTLGSCRSVIYAGQKEKKKEFE